MKRARARRIASPLLVLVAALCLLVGDLTLYAGQALFSSDAFADRTTSALRQREVRELLGARVADELVRAEPDLIGGKPLIEAAVAGIAASAPLQQLLAGGLRDVHATALGESDDTATLKLADVGVLVADALRALNPGLAARIPKDLDARLVAVSEGSAFTDLTQLAEDVELAELISLALALLLFALAIALAPERGVAVQRVGVALAAVGAAVVLAFEAGRALVADRLDDAVGRDAARALFDALLLDLRTWNLALAAVGLIVAAAAASLIRPLDAAALLRRAWRVASARPRQAWLRGARAVALVAVGIAIVAWHEAFLRLAVVALGLLVLYLGAAELLRMSVPAQPAAGAEPRGTPRRRRARLVMPAAAALAAAAGVLAVGALAADDDERPPVELRACNGHAALCDRALDRISLPSTHNSMSAASEPGWLFAEQESGIREQLRRGIRGFLIDTHYGVRTKQGVYTILQRGSKSRAKIEDELGGAFVASAEQLRARIGYRGGGKREVYLCHAYCELGATKAETALGWMRDFLLANPFEVLVLSVEDDTAPRDTARAFEASGLLELVWKGPVRAGDLPTPREMIERGERVLVMAENRTGGIPWYREQFELVQETPFDLTSVAALGSPQSCRPNRGAAANPIFMLNNWVETVPATLPSNARRVNGFDALLRRARTCQRRRGRLPALVAVDFYEEGDVVGVSDALNGVRRRGAP